MSQGKGSGQRPKSISEEEFQKRWDIIFKKGKTDGRKERKNKRIQRGKPTSETTAE